MARFTAVLCRSPECLALLCVIALAANAAASQEAATPASSSRTISGRVIADDTGDPLHNARVSLSPAAQGTPFVLADADGRFTIAAPAGRYSVVASKTGYARREVAAVPSDRVEIRLMRSAAVSGRVVDETGDPVAGARVVAGTFGAPNDRLAVAAQTDTDERG